MDDFQTKVFKRKTKYRLFNSLYIWILWLYVLNHIEYLKNLKIKLIKKNKPSLSERKDGIIILGKF